ncbi:MAG: hypothetical protein WB995_16735, partial [Candidatus Acidiferrales bacterium]
KTKTPNQEQNQIQSTSRTPLEKTLEADISIWRKTGHFYFALTANGGDRPPSGMPKIWIG